MNHDEALGFSREARWGNCANLRPAQVLTPTPPVWYIWFCDSPLFGALGGGEVPWGALGAGRPLAFEVRATTYPRVVRARR